MHKHAKKDYDQYPSILASRLVNNACFSPPAFLYHLVSCSGIVWIFSFILLQSLLKTNFEASVISRNFVFFTTEQIQNKEVEGADRGKHLAEMQV